MAAGADAVHVSAYHDPASAIGPTESYAPHVPGLLIDNARAVKEAIEGPVIAVGRITPDAADAAIADGAFDFVSMARMILAEPELPNLLAAGRPEEIRPCVYHYRCIGNIFVRGPGALRGQRLGGPGGRAGRSGRPPRRARCWWSAAGPAGMEAARVAALRGHSVTLVDAAPRLGGRWAYAAATSDVNADLLRWLEHQLALRGVTVRVGERIDADAVLAVGRRRSGRRHRRALGPSRVPGCRAPARARGRRPRRVVVRATNALGDDVVVLGGDLPGLGIAERAAADGARVTVLEPSDVFGLHLGLPGRWRRVHDLRAAGIVLAGGAEVSEITADAVRWRDLDGDHETPADAVFTTLDADPDTTLADELRSARHRRHRRRRRRGGVRPARARHAHRTGDRGIAL